MQPRFKSQDVVYYKSPHSPKIYICYINLLKQISYESIVNSSTNFSNNNYSEIYYTSALGLEGTIVKENCSKKEYFIILKSYMDDLIFL